MLSLPRRAPVRVPFDRRTDDPRALVLKESGRYAALDTLNRALAENNTIRLCRPRFECDSPLKCVTCSVYRLAERRADLQAALRGAPAAVMVTLTTAHGHLPLAAEWTELEKILIRFTDPAPSELFFRARPAAVRHLGWQYFARCDRASNALEQYSQSFTG